MAIINTYGDDEMLNLVAIRGGGDIATGIAYKLYKSGFNIVILEAEKPLSIRRKVSFSEAIYEGEAVVEGVKSVYVQDINDVGIEIKKGNIPVLVDRSAESIKLLRPEIVVDAIIAKKNLGTNRSFAPITIGIGPKFVAGLDVDLVIESMRGHCLGTIIEKGESQSNTGIPGSIMGFTEERVIRAVEDGIISNLVDIGDHVEKGDRLAKINDKYVYATISGIVRGLIRDGLYVEKGLKIGDVDPRDIREYAFTISDKARTIGGSVLEGILYMQRRMVS